MARLVVEPLSLISYKRDRMIYVAYIVLLDQLCILYLQTSC
jgi:hypothetical protein